MYCYKRPASFFIKYLYFTYLSSGENLGGWATLTGAPQTGHLSVLSVYLPHLVHLCNSHFMLYIHLVLSAFSIKLYYTSMAFYCFGNRFNNIAEYALCYFIVCSSNFYNIPWSTNSVYSYTNILR